MNTWVDFFLDKATLVSHNIPIRIMEIRILMNLIKET